VAGGEVSRFPVASVDDRGGAAAFFFGVVFNQGQRALKSWLAPLRLRDRLGTLDPVRLRELPMDLLEDAVRRPTSLHRFPRMMARYMSVSCGMLVERYAGDARRIWSPPARARELLARLEAFPGIGRHKAEVAVFLLTVEFGVPVVDDGTVIAIASSCPGLYDHYFPVGEALFV
jgi:uncharacterized HhH-GPD family protein